MGVNYNQKEVCIFKIYEEFHKKVFQVRVLLFIAYSTCGSHSMLDALKHFSKHSWKNICFQITQQVL